MRYFAHTREGDSDTEHWQTLEDHLEGVAQRAEHFAAKFDAGPAGRLIGLWHDLGKYHSRFQERLFGATHPFEHAGAGAALAAEKAPRDGTPLAFAIAGHHGGLANARGGEGKPSTPLSRRLSANVETLNALRANVPNALLNEGIPPLPPYAMTRPESLEFWTRMLYSCLVDADWLDTEAFLDETRSGRRGAYDDMPALQSRLDAYIDGLAAACTNEAKARATFQVRQAILHACREAATWEPGLFSLTAPTGSGKTLSALSFALNHAKRSGLDRVIVVIPYTSIIEQNARVYRQALGDHNVVEHHANLDPRARRDELGDEITERHELATENWDAPVVVTTTVQFFESLFSNRRGRCRKLHNVAKSVVVFDEVQTLPPGFRYPLLDAMKELSANFGASLVLSTATQPAIARRTAMDFGLERVREIVPEPDNAAETLKRVQIVFPDPDSPPTDWETLADRLAAHHQVLAIVHKRNDAHELAALLAQRAPEVSVYHLSALMCPKHRLDVLDTVRKALDDGAPCRLVATQLIEAGVDVDFPVVYRALGGLDSIIQAAGRCNREGRLESGQVVVFRAPTTPPPGTPAQGLNVMESMLRENPALTPHQQASIHDYFRSLYAAVPPDQAGIQGRRKQFQFAEVASRFKLIEDGFTHPVYVPYGQSPKLVKQLAEEGASLEVLRALQAYQISLYRGEFSRLLSNSTLVEILPGLHALSDAHSSVYHARFGWQAEQ